ncbi:hypothetical protein KBD59_04585 [Candidatus Gracilibacteria bacterium]|nr:hypothetical protein [Candidatus Gracilibacteria bacterium]
MKFIPGILITVALTLLISNYFLNKGSTVIPVDNQLITGSVQGSDLKYFNEGIIVVSENQNDKEKFVLEMDLSRKEINKGNFLHYYTAHIFQNGKKKTIQTNFYSNSPEIKANAFLPSYTHTTADDLSTRENYVFSLTIDDKKIKVSTSGLEGDFITKNDIAYTRYLSIGKGDVEMNGEKIKTNVVLENIYSADSGKYLFFSDIEELSSRTYRFLVWDTDNNFYLLDDSTVSRDSPFYRPHTWVLYKNAAGNYMQKFFEAKVSFQESEKTWKVTLPNLSTELTLTTPDSIAENWTSGSVTGTAKTKDGTKAIFGSYSYKKS